MMVNTLAIRNWAYVHQMETIAYELADFVEPLFSNTTGFKSHSLLDVLFGIISLTENKLNNHHRKTNSFIKTKTYNDTFNKYEQSFPQVLKNEKTQREKTGLSIKKVSFSHSILQGLAPENGEQTTHCGMARFKSKIVDPCLLLFPFLSSFHVFSF